jgi:hypothetical protein
VKDRPALAGGRSPRGNQGRYRDCPRPGKETGHGLSVLLRTPPTGPPGLEELPGPARVRQARAGKNISLLRRLGLRRLLLGV